MTYDNIPIKGLGCAYGIAKIHHTRGGGGVIRRKNKKEFKKFNHLSEN